MHALTRLPARVETTTGWLPAAAVHLACPLHVLRFPPTCASDRIRPACLHPGLQELEHRVTEADAVGIAEELVAAGFLVDHAALRELLPRNQ